MKTGLIVAGVGVLLAAVYFIARGKVMPTLNNKQMSGQQKPPNPNVSLASQLLTSQNVGALATLFGGAAKPAPAAGVNGSGIVTALPNYSPNKSDTPSDFVTTIDNEA